MKTITLTYCAIAVVAVVATVNAYEQSAQLDRIEALLIQQAAPIVTARNPDLVSPENLQVLEWPVEPPKCWIDENGIDMVCSDPSCYVAGLEQHCIYESKGWSIIKKGL